MGGEAGGGGESGEAGGGGGGGGSGAARIWLVVWCVYSTLQSFALIYDVRRIDVFWSSMVRSRASPKGAMSRKERRGERKEKREKRGKTKERKGGEGGRGRKKGSDWNWTGNWTGAGLGSQLNWPGWSRLERTRGRACHK